MPTKYSRYCDGVMEAGWIASVILVPLFFNVYSSRIFEPDKLTLLRSLALLTLGAWVLKLIFEGGARWENLQKGDSAFKTILRMPLMLPVLALVCVYLLATLFSVNPRISLFGSYMRLQGTYTTFSYLVIFAAMVANLRQRAQLDRFVSALILTSLPISLYGVLQRYGIDPVPWAGDVTVRVASNMGNAIFVAAYLIMANPFTLLRAYESFSAILKSEQGSVVQIVRATAYVFIAALQLIALYLSGSRGPWLGWMAGSFFLFVLLTLYLRKRALMLSVMALGLVLGSLLLLLNIPNGPLESIRHHPYLGRIGHLAEAESATGRVRVLIWEGAAELFAPHEPLEYPGGSKDTFNFLRPLIGYGPETMHVAFNRFYPPELGTLEKRNASPDRSHNETWDSLVITGVLGMGVYLLLFGSVFYYGLKWLGLIASVRERNLFLIFYLVSGLLGAVGFALWRGVAFIGIGLPFGIIVGMIAYLILDAIFGSRDMTSDVSSVNLQKLYIIASLAAIAAHFVETNFGIAIAATRTLFWTSAAVMFIVGYVMPKLEQPALPSVEKQASQVTESTEAVLSSRRKKGKGQRHEKVHRSANSPLLGNRPGWWRSGLIAMILLSIFFLTLGYEFISNPKQEETTVGTILVNSFTRLANQEGAYSPGVLALMLTTWLAGGAILITDENLGQKFSDWLRALLLALGGSLLIALFLWLLHAQNLVSIASSSPSNRAELLTHLQQLAGLLTWYYGVLCLLLLCMAFFLPERWPMVSSVQASWQPAVGVVGLVIVIVLSFATNINAIRANMIFKMGENLGGDQWPAASIIFQRTIELQPKEDFYYLYLGRSYLETAKMQENPAEKDAFMQRANQVLQDALELNPLNTDHSANLARMYNWWASQTEDTQIYQERVATSERFYRQALSLSPNTTPLWTELAGLLLSSGMNEQAREALLHAVELDETYALAQAMLGDYYIQKTQTLSAGMDEYTQTLRLAAERYGLAGSTTKEAADPRVSYYSKQGNIYIQIKDYDAAVEAFLNALELKRDSEVSWQLEETLARVYMEMGDKQSALQYAQQAQQSAPVDSLTRLQELIDLIQTAP